MGLGCHRGMERPSRVEWFPVWEAIQRSTLECPARDKSSKGSLIQTLAALSRCPHTSNTAKLLPRTWLVEVLASKSLL